MDSPKSTSVGKNRDVVFSPISRKIDSDGEVKTTTKLSRASIAYVPENLDPQSESHTNTNKAVMSNYKYPDIPLVQINELKLREINEKKVKRKTNFGTENDEDIDYGDGELSKASRSLDLCVDEFQQTVVALNEISTNMENNSTICEQMANLNRVQCVSYRSLLRQIYEHIQSQGLLLGIYTFIKGS